MFKMLLIMVILIDIVNGLINTNEDSKCPTLQLYSVYFNAN